MESPNLKRALEALTVLLKRQEVQAKALRTTDEAIERAKAEVAKLVAAKS